MTRKTFAQLVNPWKFRREQEERRIADLRSRDGENCARCRRPVRFDLTSSHDQGPVIERMGAAGEGQPESLDGLFLCHRRCNAAGADNTSEVQDRVRRKNEAALFANNRQRA